MSIRERRPGVWQIRAYAGIDEAGRSKYVYRTFMGSKSDARKEEMRLKAMASSFPKQMAEQSLTLDMYFQRWFSLYVEPTAATSTQSAYNYKYWKMISPKLGVTKLSKLTPDLCQQAFNEMLLQYSRASVATARAILSACLKRARISGLILSNPLIETRLPRKQQQHARALTTDELARFVEAARSHRHGPLLITAALTGMRRGELLSLTWDNVDLSKSVIHVREGGAEPGTTKSRAGQRDVIMPTLLVELLLGINAIEEEKRKADESWNVNRFVFPSKAGIKIHHCTNLKSALNRILSIAGIPIEGFRLHDLRHSHGSILVNAGVPVTDVAGRLGQMVQTTVQTYLHSDGSGNCRITDCLDKATGIGDSNKPRN